MQYKVQKKEMAYIVGYVTVEAEDETQAEEIARNSEFDEIELYDAVETNTEVFIPIVTRKKKSANSF